MGGWTGGGGQWAAAASNSFFLSARYVGELISTEEAAQREEHGYCFALDGPWQQQVPSWVPQGREGPGEPPHLWPAVGRGGDAVGRRKRRSERGIFACPPHLGLLPGRALLRQRGPLREPLVPAQRGGRAGGGGGGPGEPGHRFFQHAAHPRRRRARVGG